MELDTTDKASDFDWHSPVRRRRLRPRRGLQYDDRDENLDLNLEAQSPHTDVTHAYDYTLQLPFEPHTCTICMRGTQSNYLLLNLKGSSRIQKTQT